MKVKALKSFGGLVSMKKGEIREIENKVIISDLLSAGYITEVKDESKAEKSKNKKAKK